MTKPKAQTLQQKLGFFDEDLKKPKHDELMLWLDNNIEKIINNLFNKPYSTEEIEKIKDNEFKKIKLLLDKFKDHIDSLTKELNSIKSGTGLKSFQNERTIEELEELIQLKEGKIDFLNKFISNSDIPSKPKITNFHKKWELPISTGNSNYKNTIGFIDFAVSFRVPFLQLEGLKYDEKEFSHNLDYYDFDENKLEFKYFGNEKSIYVEVKTEIKTLGELIRQINLYKSYLQGDYYVLCPDDKFRNVLNDQGIKFIDYN